MQNCRIGLAIGLTAFLAGCLEPEIEYVNVIPVVPPEFLNPVVVPERTAETLVDVGLILTDHIEGLAVANGRIVAIDCILTAAEAGVDPDCK